jgi:hypothetical protein
MRINARASVRAAFRQCDALTIASMLPGAGRKYHQSRFASRCHMARFKWRYVTKRLNRPRFQRYSRHGAWAHCYRRFMASIVPKPARFRPASASERVVQRTELQLRLSQDVGASGVRKTD